MRKLIRDLTPGQDYLLQFRINDGTNVSAWSQVYRFRTDGDVTAPANPGNLVWKATGESFLATWDRPTLDGNGKPLKDLKDYEVTVSANGVSKTFYTVDENFNFGLARNAETFGGIELTVTIVVKSRDYTLNLSSGVTKTATEDTPPTPSTPTAKAEVGQVSLKWDGKTVVGTVNPLNLSHIEIHASQTNNFTATDATHVDRFEGMFSGPQEKIVAGLGYGTWYFKLIAVNKKGKRGAASGQATATRARLTGLDIDTQNGLNASQMNFTARDLGGANAFYLNALPSSGTTTINGLSVKDGDILYITAAPPAANAGNTYRRTAGAWVEDTSIGVISGLKILTNTLTADAVGTNLIIANKANIADGIIDNAKIANLDAGKITTGQLQSSSMVSYGGSTPRPAWQLSMNGDAQLNSVNVRGDLVIGNSGDPAAVRAASMTRSYDYMPGTAGWAIKGDGTVEFNNGTFRGTINGSAIIGSSYKTDTTGRRIEVGVAGSAGAIDFYSPSGVKSILRSHTETTGKEAIQLGIPVPGTSSLWNIININRGTDTEGEVSTIRSGTVEFVFDSAPPNSDGRFIVYQTSGRSAANIAASKIRLFIDRAGTTINDPAGIRRFSIDTNGTWIGAPNNDTRMVFDGDGAAFYEDLNFFHQDGRAYGAFTAGEFWWGPGDAGVSSRRVWINPDRALFTPWGDQDGRIEIWHANNLVDQSARIRFVTKKRADNNVFYAWIKSWQGVIEIRNNDDSDFGYLRSGEITATKGMWSPAFTPSSDMNLKEDIQTLEPGSLDKIRNTRVTRYKGKKDKGNIDPTIQSMGLIAQEAPPELVRTNPMDGTLGIELYSMASMNWAGLQEAAVEIDSLKNEVAELRTQVAALTKKNGEKK